MFDSELSYRVGCDSLMSSDWLIGFGDDGSERKVGKFYQFF